VSLRSLRREAKSKGIYEKARAVVSSLGKWESIKGISSYKDSGLEIELRGSERDYVTITYNGELVFDAYPRLGMSHVLGSGITAYRPDILGWEEILDRAYGRRKEADRAWEEKKRKERYARFGLKPP